MGDGQVALPLGVAGVGVGQPLPDGQGCAVRVRAAVRSPAATARSPRRPDGAGLSRMIAGVGRRRTTRLQVMPESGSLIPFIPFARWEGEDRMSVWVGLKPRSAGKRGISIRILRSVVPLTVSVAILAGCTSTGAQTSQSAATDAMPAPSSASSVGGNAPVGTLEGVTTAAELPGVQSYIAALIANQDDALQQVEPGTGAYLFTQAAILINRTRGQAVNFVETVDGSYQGSGYLLSDFQVDSAGKIATFQRNHLPIDQVYVPGDGTTYKSSDGTLSVVVDSFRHFDLNAEGNTSVVFALSNTGTSNATLAVDKYTAGGVDYPVTDKDDAPPGEQVTLPTPLGKIPGGGRLTITLTATGTPTTFEIDVPVWS